MSKKNGDNPDRARRRLAQETARIIIEQGLRDHRNAKIKAAEKLGMRNYGSLPSNEEIEQAISEYLQLFGGKSHANFLVTMRAASLSAMRMLTEFEPRLAACLVPLPRGNVKDVCTGTITVGARPSARAIAAVARPQRTARTRPDRTLITGSSSLLV